MHCFRRCLGGSLGAFSIYCGEVLKIVIFFAAEPSGNYQTKHGSSPGRVISKWDLGFFLVDCLDKPEHYRQMVGIAKPPQA